MEQDGNIRLLLWCVPRSCSTLFSKVVSQVENTQILFEPFAKAYYLGEERVSRRYAHRPPVPNKKFTDVKLPLEENHNVFVKDMAFYVHDFLDRFDKLIPEGYQHTFLIRHPRQTVASLYKISTNGLSDWDYFDPAEAEFQTLHDLFLKIKEESGETPVVVDAGDLLDNPEQMLKLYCMKTGLPFSKDMLTWEKGETKDFKVISPGWTTTLYQSTGFIKPAKEEVIELSEEAQKAIDENIEYYNDLYKYRISL